MLPRLCLLLLFSLPLSQSDDCVFGSGNATDGRQTVTIAAILPKTNTEYPWSWLRVAPALYQAISRVNCDPWLLPGLKLHLVNGNSENTDGYCSDSMAPLVAVDLKLAHDPWAFIGPGCEFSSSPVARFTTHWDVPMVTAGARATGFKFYAAVTNTGPTHAKLGEFSLKIQQAFDWLRHVMLVYTDNNKDSNYDRPYYFTVEGVYEMLRVQNITTYDYSLETDINYKLAVQKIRDNGRGQLPFPSLPALSPVISRRHLNFDPTAAFTVCSSLGDSSSFLHFISFTDLLSWRSTEFIIDFYTVPIKCRMFRPFITLTN